MSAPTRLWQTTPGTWHVPARPGPRVRIAVAVEEDALGRLEDVASACRRLGFQQASALPSVGVITGSIAIERLSALRAVSGVAAVEPERAAPVVLFNDRSR